MISNPEYYHVADLGPRPHNLPPNGVLSLLRQSPDQEHTLLSFKPDFYPSHPRTGDPLQAPIEAELVAAGLDVVCTGKSVLGGWEVSELYRDVLPPNPEDEAKFGVEWKQQLLRYMTSGPLFTYLLRGPNAFQTAHTIKNDYRRRYIVEGDAISKVVQNVGHVPDPEDFDLSLKILMLGGISLAEYGDNRRQGEL